MKPTTVLKLIVDLVMVVLFITMVFAPQTGYLYHEVFGLVIGALVILHLFLNKTWIAGILKKRGALKPTLKKKAIFNLAIGLLTAGIIVTGILISHHRHRHPHLHRPLPGQWAGQPSPAGLCP